MKNYFKMYRDQCHWLSSLFGLSTLQSFMIRPTFCYTRLLYIQIYHDPCVPTYYSVEAKPHNTLICKNTNNNNIYNLKYTLITHNNLYNKFTLYMATFFSLEKLNHTLYCNSLIFRHQHII